MEKTIYVISGLGADARVFKNVQYGEFTPVFVNWIPPLVEENIQEYAFRLSRQIIDPKPIIMGLSFGGIMAIEIAKQIPTAKIILIASAKTRSEIPFYLKWIGSLNLHHFIPVQFFKYSNAITYFFFGATTSENKALLRQILKDTDPTFLKWAINSVLKWNNEEHLQHVTHIHGAKDRILPLKFVKADIVIGGGGHFMTLDKHEFINRDLEEILQ